MKITKLDWAALVIFNGLMICVVCSVNNPNAWWMLPISMDVMTLQWWRNTKEIHAETKREG